MEKEKATYKKLAEKFDSRGHRDYAYAEKVCEILTPDTDSSSGEDESSGKGESLVRG